MEYNHGKKSLWQWALLYVLIGVAVYGALWYFVFNKQLPVYNTRTNFNIEDLSPETAGWKTYRNDEYGFEIQYPGDWKYGFEGTTSFVKPIIWFCPARDEECRTAWISVGSQYGEYAYPLGNNMARRNYYSLWINSFPESDGNSSIYKKMRSTFKFTK
mgnify:FL=1